MERFPIVGIGASAGGLDAFTQLLQHLPPDTGMAFVLVQHLDPQHESRLTELLARATPMPVAEASHGARGPAESRLRHPAQRRTSPFHAASCRSPRATKVAARTCRSTSCSARWPRTSRHGRSASCCRAPAPTARSACARSRRSAASPSRRTRSPPGIPACRAARSTAAASTSSCRPTRSRERLAELGEHPYLAPDPTRPRAEADRRRTATSGSSPSSAPVTGVDFRLYRDTTIQRRIMRRMALHAPAVARRLRRAARERSRRGRRALPRPPDQRHQLLPRPRDVRGAQGSASSPSSSKATLADRADPHLGAGLLDRPGGLLARDGAARVPRHAGRCGPPIQIFATDLSDQTALDKARAGRLPGSDRGRGVARAPAALLQARGPRLPDRQVDPRPLRLRAAERHRRSAVLPPRPDQLPQRADLPGDRRCRSASCRRSTTRSTRPGFLVLGSAETVGEHTRPVRAGRPRAPDLRQEAGDRDRHPFQFPTTDCRRLAAAATDTAARAPGAGTSRRKPTASCSAATRRRASSSTRTSTSSSSAAAPRLPRSRPPASRPPTCSRWRARACSSSCAARSPRPGRREADRCAATGSASDPTARSRRSTSR